MARTAQSSSETPVDLHRHSLAVLAIVVVGLLFLMHPYEGLIHDARLYTLQALNHLHPELYGNDVFLKFGSQDSYTLFTPVYAAAIRFLGAEPAASLLTCLSVVFLLTGAWVLARSLMSAHLAWLGLGVLALMPGFYGEGVVFSVVEGFLTPRMLAEAAVLLAMAAWLKDRRRLALVLLLAGMVIHPIMSLPGAILLLVLGWGLRSSRVLWSLAIAALLAALLALGGWIPVSRWQFDASWWPQAEWAPHLLLGNWSAADWARLSTVVATLYLGARCLPARGRSLTIGMLVVTSLTLLLSWIGGDLLRLVLVVQGQAWRSLWLATTLAALLLPWTATQVWGSSTPLRCSLLLLLTAWLLGHSTLALYFSVPAMIVASLPLSRLAPFITRLAERSALVLLSVVLLCMLVLNWTEKGGNMGAEPDTAAWLQFLRALSADGILPAAVLAGAWIGVTRLRSRRGLAALVVAVSLPVVLIAAEAARPLARIKYPADAHRTFASWRTLIPAGSDVLWSTRVVSGSDPSSVWLLLERPSYFSSVQFNSGLFSRAAALEMNHRYNAIPRSLPTEQPIKIVYSDRGGSAPECGEIPVRFVVSETRITGARLVPAPASAKPPFDRLVLQICP